MIQRMLASALFAGFAAGLLAALLHFAFVQDLILLGEQYETGELTHFDTATPPPAAHDHGTAATDAAEVTGVTGATGATAHDHGPAPSNLKRNALTVLFAGLIYVAYALILVAGFALAEQFGKRITLREGVLWGLAGFFAFQMAPAMGLAPELPGTIAADLGDRQVWWWGTVLATATALALLAYGRGPVVWAVAAVLLAAPHLVGAPLPDGYWGMSPPEVGALFSARVLGTALVVWAALGAMAGHLWSRGAQTA